ncbi:MAG TPA: YHS domain-containing protein [Tepidisphaeraceae bacterium]|nr:YHS domain-containing protein [Tepidisphaeraceae bacterium]
MRRLNLFALFMALGLALLSAGCAAEAAPTTQSANVIHADCLVCKMNFDLACIDVAVDPKTPQYMYNGHTYYFCSDECKDKFAKDPAKYVPK